MDQLVLDLPLEVYLTDITKDFDVALVPKTQRGLKKVRHLNKKIKALLQDEKTIEGFGVEKKNIWLAVIVVVLLFIIAGCAARFST